MAKILRIQDDPHYADYAELSTPPLPDFKAASKTSQIFSGVAILACIMGLVALACLRAWPK